jgi:MFS family permease
VPTTLRPVAVAFVVFGLLGGAFAVATVDIERTFGLSDAGLGLLLAAGIIAGTFVAAIGGAITDRWGAGRSLARALVLWGLLLALEAFAHTLRSSCRRSSSRWRRAGSST